MIKNPTQICTWIQQTSSTAAGWELSDLAAATVTGGGRVIKTECCREKESSLAETANIWLGEEKTGVREWGDLEEDRTDNM